MRNVSISAMRDKDGEIKEMIAVVNDRTGQMLAEEALIEGEENQFKEKYEKMIKGSDSGVWAVDSDGETIMMNERMAEDTGTL